MYSEPCQTSEDGALSRLDKVIGSAFWLNLISFCQSSKVFLPKCYALVMVLNSLNGVH